MNVVLAVDVSIVACIKILECSTTYANHIGCTIEKVNVPLSYYGLGFKYYFVPSENSVLFDKFGTRIFPILPKYSKLGKLDHVNMLRQDFLHDLQC